MLPPTATDVLIEARKKSTKGIGLRLYDTYSMKTGMSLDNLHAIGNQEQTMFSTASAFRRELIFEHLLDGFSYDSQPFLVQDEPQPAAILSVTRDVDIGDDKE